MRLRTLLAASAALVGVASIAHADLAVTAGSGTTLFDFTCFTTKHCGAAVIINSAGTEILTTTNPGQVGVAQGSTTSGQVGGLGQGAVTTSAPSYTTAQTSPLSLTTGGALRVDASSAAVSANATQIGTWTVQPGNTANTTAWLVTGTGGTFPATQSGTWVSRLQDGAGNAITSDTRGSERPLSVQILDASGNQVTTFGSTGGTSSSYGSGFPATGTGAGFSDGTNMQGARVFDADSGGGTQYVLGTNLRAISSGGSVETGVAANPLQVSLANTAANATAVKVDGSAVTQPASVAGLLLTQGSTTSGQSGILAQGSVTTAAPSYTTAQTSPLNLTTGGALRSDMTTIAGNAVKVGSGTGSSTGSLNVYVATDQPSLTNPQPGDFVKIGGNNVSTAASGVQKVGIVGAAAATVDAAVGAGTAPTNMLAVGGLYNSTEPTLTTGQSAAVQLDAKGRQKAAIWDAAGNARGANVTAANALVVDGSAVTQPISGGLSDGTNTAKVLAASAQATATDKSLVVQVNPNQPALTTTPQGDFTKIAGTAVDVNSGNKSAGTQRVVLATDQPALTNGLTVAGSGTAGAAATGVVTIQGIASMTKLLVTPDANSAVNVAQINGVTALMGNGATGTGSQRVTLSDNNSAIATWGQGATGAAAPAGAVQLGTIQSGATGGWMKGVIACDNHVFKHITSATDTLAVQGVTSQSIYICGWRSRAAGVATWFLENTNDTNANCSGSKTQITGVATEAANTGETWGGAFWSGLKNTSGNGLCINSTGTGGVDIDLWFAQL